MINISTEIKELTNCYKIISGQNPDLQKELDKLINTDDDVVLLLYSRRSLEVIVRDICDKENIKISDTIPLKGIIDKLNKEKKVPSNIITSMLNLNSSSVYGAHPKEFDSGQVRTALINLASILTWFIEYIGIGTYSWSQPLPQSQSDTLSKSKGQPEKSIVVLPFANMSSDPEQEYFSDGLTEEIITDLSYIHDLLVISRSSAMTFKGSKKKIKEIASEINVSHVLEGSVRKAGNKLRITAQLIEANTDTHLWAEKYDGTLEDIFDIQEKVSLSIADSIKIKLDSIENNNILDHPIENVHAYECYLKSRKLLWEFNPESLKKAELEIKKALEIVGENELLYASMGWIYNQYVESGHRDGMDYIKKSEFYINKIFELSPDSANAYGLKGLNCHHKGEIQEAVINLKKSLLISPNDPDVLLMICYCYAMAGRVSSAKPFLDRLLNIDPLNPVNYSMAGFNEVCNNNFKKALVPYSKMHDLSKLHPLYSIFYIWCLGLNNERQKAITIIEKMEQKLPDSIFMHVALFFKNAWLGNNEIAFNLFTEEDKSAFKKSSYWSRIAAYCYSLINKKEEAINYLEITVGFGFINYPYLNEFNPFLKNIRGEKRFKKLMKKVKRKWENFEV